MSEDATSPTVALRGSSNTFVNAAGDNFHLAVGDDAIGEGTDLSADGDFAFDDDIDGDTIVTWDIGFDEYVAAGGQSIVPLLGDTMGGSCNPMRGL